MNPSHLIRSFIAVLLCGFLVGCSLSVNKSFEIADGETFDRGINTVNGDIRIGSSCIIRGNCRTVNGSLRVGDASKVRDLQTVNGEIRLGQDVLVDGKIESVNGGIRCAEGTLIRRGIHAINGDIVLQNTEVMRSITSYNSQIELRSRSLVNGDIVIKRSKGTIPQKPLKIVITDSSRVEGDIRVQEDARKVIVVFSNGGQVKGDIENAAVEADSLQDSI